MPTPHLRKFWTVLILLAGMVGSMFVAGQWAWQRSLHEESDSVQRQLALYGQALAQRIDRYRTLPEVLALDAQLQGALRRPLSPAEVAQLNHKLEQANGASQSSTLTLLNRDGLAVAASNWRTDTSNVGVDYSFRPYVQQALAQGRGSFYGIGVTTGEPGYFLSQAIQGDDGQVLGLVAIKIALQELEREWRQTPDTVLASDAHGVVFLASQDAWRYRLLEPLDDEERRELNATRQYSDQPLRPLDYRVDDHMDNGGRLVRMLPSPDLPTRPGRVLWQTQPLPGTPWQLHLVHDTHNSVADSRWAAAAGAGGWLALALLVLFARQRRRLAALRELRSLADALEQRVADRTRDLDAARREAEQANRYKTRFVAAAVHDLLQPLNAARMFTSLLRSHPQSDADQQQRTVDSIDGALAAQDAILGSLLDISRMESGQLDVHVRDVALGPLLQVLAHNFGVLAERRGLTLTCVPTHAVVRTDENLLRRIVQNFVSNAIRYSRRGRIVVGCRRVGERLLRIEVHDQGPGIPEALQREIFEEFRRLDEGHADDRGAGLGLAIVERLGRLLGHEIGLRSQLGRGSVFWVCVPLGDPAAAQQAAAPATTAQQPGDDAPLQGCSAWVVEDDGPTCAATQALLERWGCEVPLAGGAPQALAAAQPGQAPQLVLLDVHLGGHHHGPDVYTALCQRWGQTPAVILVTAERDATLRRQAAERGWGFLAKPVRAPALRALMSQTLLRLREKG
ncbi:ATP-binding protein [Acidovorax sp.]|uniref:hybrid sensor histidine kinase/response regulator n=1 Tax=Acidovorax sp. TaxID=1872122 RepID=UPI00261B9D69|nr:ATP-binding protein [Acidovorax sp.]